MREVFHCILAAIKLQGDTFPMFVRAYPQLKTLSLDCDGRTPEEKSAVALVYLCRDEGKYNGFAVAINGVVVYLKRNNRTFSREAFLRLKDLLDSDCSASDVENFILAESTSERTDT